jgi:hypothetical protein
VSEEQLAEPEFASSWWGEESSAPEIVVENAEYQGEEVLDTSNEPSVESSGESLGEPASERTEPSPVQPTESSVNA